MDPRVYNGTLVTGVLLVGVGTGLQVSWPAACIAVGAILLFGAFRAAGVVASRG
jgi:hypothetical protein